MSKLTVDNFLYYAKNNLYKKSSFHRIIEGFMIQGGIVDETIDPIVGEFYNNGYPNNLYHYRGVISMARTSYPNSATSQFFIVHKDSHFLNGDYASFGGLVSGFEVLDLIANSITNFNDAPIDIITIENVEVYLNGYKYNN